MAAGVELALGCDCCAGGAPRSLLSQASAAEALGLQLRLKPSLLDDARYSMLESFKRSLRRDTLIEELLELRSTWPQIRWMCSWTSVFSGTRGDCTVVSGKPLGAGVGDAISRRASPCIGSLAPKTGGPALF